MSQSLLPLGAITPEGWIRAQMLQDYEQGFLGCLDRLTEEAAWGHFSHRQVGSGGQNADDSHHAEWWGGESEAVWMDGLVRLAFLTEIGRAHV